MNETPCAHLIEREHAECQLGRLVPEDCRRACAYYHPGLTEQERIRATLWAAIIGARHANQ